MEISRTEGLSCDFAAAGAAGFEFGLDDESAGDGSDRVINDSHGQKPRCHFLFDQSFCERTAEAANLRRPTATEDRQPLVAKLSLDMG